MAPALKNRYQTGNFFLREREGERDRVRERERENFSFSKNFTSASCRSSHKYVNYKIHAFFISNAFFNSASVLLNFLTK